MEDLIKGELDWHNKVNENFHEVDSQMADITKNIESYIPFVEHFQQLNEDWTNAIQTALNSFNEKGGTLLFLNKTYNTKSFTIPNNVKIIGASLNSIIKTDDIIYGNSNVEISRLNFKTATVRPSDTNLFDNTAITIYFKNSQNCKINNCSGDGLTIIYDNVNGGICKNNAYMGGNNGRSSCQAINNSKYLLFKNNDISYSTGDGFHCSSSNFITYELNKSHNNGLCGFFSEYSNVLTYNNNEAYDNTAYDGFDINLSSDLETFETKRNLIFTKNKSHNNKASGILIMASNCIISENISWENGALGFRMKSKTGDITISTGNIITKNIIYNNNKNNSPNGSGIAHLALLSGVSKSIIANNQIFQITGMIEQCLNIDSGDSGTGGIDNIITGNEFWIAPEVTADIILLKYPSKNIETNNFINGQPTFNLAGATFNGNIADNNTLATFKASSSAPDFVQAITGYDANNKLRYYATNEGTIYGSKGFKTDIGSVLNPIVDIGFIGLAKSNGTLYLIAKDTDGTYKKIAFTS